MVEAREEPTGRSAGHLVANDSIRTLPKPVDFDLLIFTSRVVRLRVCPATWDGHPRCCPLRAEMRSRTDVRGNKVSGLSMPRGFERSSPVTKGVLPQLEPCGAGRKSDERRMGL